MGSILAIINQKGGVGKSTTAQAVGAGLLLRGFTVLMVDLDPQGNLSYSMGASQSGYNAMGILERPETAQEEIQHTPNGDIIASSPNLALADRTLESTGKEYRLKEALSGLQSVYDYIVVDTPPALGVLTVNALTACTGVIIPAQADVYSLHGIIQLGATIDAVKKYCNPALEILGIVITEYNGRAIISRQTANQMEQTAEQLHTKVFETKIRSCISIKEAQTVQQSIYRYAPRSNATADYKALVEEIIKGE